MFFMEIPREGRVDVIEATADERTGNVLEAVQCEVGTDVTEYVASYCTGDTQSIGSNIY